MAFKNKSLLLRNKKFKKPIKECYFTTNMIEYIDYKNTDLLKKFLNKSGEILPSNVTGTKPGKQRALAKAVKRARFLALIK